jgi:hypothetical protein
MLKNTFKNTKKFSFVISATGYEGKGYFISSSIIISSHSGPD